jgi:hypothetical protein
MEGFNGCAGPLDRMVRRRGYRLYNINNLELARFKEIFPGVSTNGFGILKIKGFDLTARTYILYSKKKPLSKTAEAFLAVLRTWRMNNRKN